MGELLPQDGIATVSFGGQWMNERKHLQVLVYILAHLLVYHILQ